MPITELLSDPNMAKAFDRAAMVRRLRAQHPNASAAEIDALADLIPEDKSPAQIWAKFRASARVGRKDAGHRPAE